MLDVAQNEDRQLFVDAIDIWVKNERQEKCLTRQQIGEMPQHKRVDGLHKAIIAHLSAFYRKHPRADVTPGVIAITCLMSNNEDGVCRLSQETIGELYHRNPSSIRDAQARLRANGTITTGRGRSAGSYPAIPRAFVERYNHIVWLIEALNSVQPRSANGNKRPNPPVRPAHLKTPVNPLVGPADYEIPLVGPADLTNPDALHCNDNTAGPTSGFNCCNIFQSAGRDPLLTFKEGRKEVKEGRKTERKSYVAFDQISGNVEPCFGTDLARAAAIAALSVSLAAVVPQQANAEANYQPLQGCVTQAGQVVAPKRYAYAGPLPGAMQVDRLAEAVWPSTNFTAAAPLQRAEQEQLDFGAAVPAENSTTAKPLLRASPRKRTPVNYSEAFCRAWDAYPRTSTMSKAAAWKNWLREGCEAFADVVIAAAKAEADRCEREAVEPRFRKHMQGWLTEQRWEGMQGEVANQSKKEEEYHMKIVAIGFKEGDWSLAKKVWNTNTEIPANIIELAKEYAKKELGWDGVIVKKT